MWQNLVKRVLAERCKRGRTLVSGEDMGDSVTQVLEDGSLEDADLVLSCNGHDPTGRLLLFPEVEQSL